HRGFREATIRKFKLGYAQDDYQAFYRFAVSKGYNPELLEKAGLIRHRNDDYYDMYRGRVIFPIQNMTGRVVGFGARILKVMIRHLSISTHPKMNSILKARSCTECIMLDRRLLNMMNAFW